MPTTPATLQISSTRPVSVISSLLGEFSDVEAVDPQSSRSLQPNGARGLLHRSHGCSGEESVTRLRTSHLCDRAWPPAGAEQALPRPHDAAVREARHAE